MVSRGHWLQPRHMHAGASFVLYNARLFTLPGCTLLFLAPQIPIVQMWQLTSVSWQWKCLLLVTVIVQPCIEDMNNSQFLMNNVIGVQHIKIFNIFVSIKKLYLIPILKMEKDDVLTFLIYFQSDRLFHDIWESKFYEGNGHHLYSVTLKLSVWNM